jgi:hypothetical protein
MKNIFFIFLAFILTTQAKADEVLAQTKFLVRNNNKVFNVQYFNSRDLYRINFGLVWANFNSSVHSNGFNLSRPKSVEFITPQLPEGCALAISSTTGLVVNGFLNGVDSLSNALSFSITGKSCGIFIETLRQNNFEAIFHDVRAMQAGAPVTSSLRLEILEIP